MFDRKPKTAEVHELDVTITHLISEFAGEDDPEKELALANTLKTLMEARTADKAAAKKPAVSPDALASIAANLLGIGLILGFEKANVITTKGLGFIPKIKI